MVTFSYGNSHITSLPSRDDRVLISVHAADAVCRGFHCSFSACSIEISLTSQQACAELLS